MTSASINALVREGACTWVLQESNGTAPLKTQGGFENVAILRYGKANEPTDKEDTYQSSFAFTHEVRLQKSMWLSHVDKAGEHRAFFCDLIEIVESVQIQDGWGRYTAQTTIQGSYYCTAKLTMPVQDMSDLYALVRYGGKFDYLQTGPVANVVVKIVDETLSQELGTFQVGPSAPVFAAILTESYKIPVGHVIRLEMWTSLSHTTTQRGSYDVAGQRMMLAFSSADKPRRPPSRVTRWSASGQ